MPTLAFPATPASQHPPTHCPPRTGLARWILTLVAGWIAGTQAGAAATATSETAPAWWPQFRGPNGSGTSAIARPPIIMGPTTGVAWKVAVPWSPSSPCVWEHRIFLTTFAEGQLETRAHDRRNGRLLWTSRLVPDAVERFHRTDGSPAASTPATDGRRVVSYFGSFGLVCHDPDGRELWRHPLPVALSGGSFGTGTSPVIAGSRVLLNRDQDRGSSLLALDLETGQTLWETPRPEARGSFGTPVVWHHPEAGAGAEVVVPGSIQVKAYDLVTGSEQWRVDRVAGLACTTPVLGDGLLFFAAWAPGKADAGFSLEWEPFAEQYDRNRDGAVTPEETGISLWDSVQGLDPDRDGRLTSADFARLRAHYAKAENVVVAIRPGGKGDISQSHVAWKFGRGLPYLPSPLHYEGRLYLVKDGGLVSSFDARSGRLFYLQERLGSAGNYYASPVAADGRIYVASLAGVLSVIQAGGSRPQVLHQAGFGERILATPALVEDQLILRTQNHLYALGPGGARR